MVARKQQEYDGGSSCGNPVDHLHGGNPIGDDEIGGQHETARYPDEIGHKSETGGGGALVEREPLGRDGGKGIQDERLPDRQSYRAGEYDVIVGGKYTPQNAENAKQHRAKPHTFVETEGVDHPGSRDGHRDINQHEEHGQHPDFQIVHTIEFGRSRGDRGETDPEKLDRDVDEHEDSKNDPAIAIDFEIILHCNHPFNKNRCQSSGLNMPSLFSYSSSSF